MPEIQYRIATEADTTAIAHIRAKNWGTPDFWKSSISSYLDHSRSPQKALKTRIIYTACLNDQVIGFIAGHLTTRYDCQGELQWLDVLEPYRRLGIATQLVTMLQEWFRSHRAHKICVDPGNDLARAFYKAKGAVNLNDHWMYWENIGNPSR